MKKAKTLDDFVKLRSAAENAPTERARKRLKELGDDGWEFEGEFMAAAGVHSRHIAAVRRALATHVVLMPHLERRTQTRRVWAGTPAFAKKLAAISGVK